MVDKYDNIVAQLRGQDPNPPAGDPNPPAGDPNPPAGDPNQTVDWFDGDDPTVLIKPTGDPQGNPDPPKDYSFIETDPDFQLLLSYKQSGKTIKDLVTDYTVVDPDKLTEQQLFNTLCDELNVPAEERAAEYELFLQKGVIDRNQILAGVRQKIATENQNKIKDLIGSNKAAADEHLRIQTAFQTDVTTVSESLKGKTLLGLQITDEMAAALKNDVMAFNFMKPDGTIDAEAITELMFLRRYVKDIVRVNASIAKNKGKAEVIAQMSNPSPGTSTQTAASATSSPEDAVNSYVNSKGK